MNIIFIHQNFPGQFRHIAAELARSGNNRVVSICQPYAPKMPGIDSVVYTPDKPAANSIHPYLESTQLYVLNGQAVVRALLKLKQNQFQPDVIVVHTGWGEALFIKEVFPDTPLIGFFEFFYHSHGADCGFDPEQPLSLDSKLRIRTRNSIHLLSLHAADLGISPTQWQRSVFPNEYQPKLRLIHEGINVDAAVADPQASIQLSSGVTLSRQTEVITFVSRNLEPYRGFHIFMRSVEEICQRRPNTHFVIVGGDDVSYGARLPNGQTYRQKLLSEVKIDASRVHFLGKIPYQHYLKVLQISSAHIYLTVPFVLSWSMLEAMSAECLVIASDTPPVREVISHQENGLLIDFFSPTAIADSVDYALDHPQQMQKLRKAARQKVLENYTHANGVNAYQALLSEVTGLAC